MTGAIFSVTLVVRIVRISSIYSFFISISFNEKFISISGCSFVMDSFVDNTSDSTFFNLSNNCETIDELIESCTIFSIMSTSNKFT